MDLTSSDFQTTVSSLKYWNSPLKTKSSKFEDDEMRSTFAFGSPLKDESMMARTPVQTSEVFGNSYMRKFSASGKNVSLSPVKQTYTRKFVGSGG